MKRLSVAFWIDEDNLRVMATSRLHREGRIVYAAKPASTPDTFGIYLYMANYQEHGEWVCTRDGRADTLRTLEHMMDAFG